MEYNMRTACRSKHSLHYLLLIAVSAVVTPAKSETVQVNGAEIYYSVFGKGDPIVLLHGFTGAGAGWSLAADDLAQDYLVIVPDLRGHGSSTNPSGTLTSRQAAQDILSLLDHLGIETFSAVGASFGAVTLTHMAIAQPDRLDAVVLIAATNYLPDQTRAVLAGIDPDNIPPPRMEQLRRLHKHGDDQIVALQRQLKAYSDDYEDVAFSSSDLATIESRTLIIHGDRDDFFPIGGAMELYTQIPNAYLWVLPNAGHYPPFMANEAESADFVRTVRKFLNDSWPTPQ